MNKGVQQLEEYIAAEGITEVAKMLGVSRQTIFRMRQKGYRPETMSLDLARRINEYTGIEYDDWFEEAEE